METQRALQRHKTNRIGDAVIKAATDIHTRTFAADESETEAAVIFPHEFTG